MVERKITEERIRVRYAETDQMGHVYYSNYLIWFEQARSAFFRERGLPYKEIEAMGFKLPVVEAHARYRGEVKYDDEVVVRVWVDEIKRSAIRVAYEVFNETTQLVTTEGYTWHVLVGSEFKAVPIPDRVRQVLQS